MNRQSGQTHSPAAVFLFTHVAQGTTASPWDTQGSFSLSSGHSLSLPIGNCLMIRVLTRVPLGDTISWHVFEQGLHSDHSDTWHSLVITQDWKVIGSFSCWQKLKKRHWYSHHRPAGSYELCVLHSRVKSAWTFLFLIGGTIIISLTIYQHFSCVKAVRLKANICIFYFCKSC